MVAVSLNRGFRDDPAASPPRATSHARARRNGTANRGARRVARSVSLLRLSDSEQCLLPLYARAGAGADGPVTVKRAHATVSSTSDVPLDEL